MKKILIILSIALCSCQIAQMPARTHEPKMSYYDAMMKTLPEPTRTEKALSKVFIVSAIVIFISAF